MDNEEKVIKQGKLNIKIGIIMFIITVFLSLVAIKNEGLETGVIILFVLFPFHAAVWIKGIRFVKNPKKYIATKNVKSSKSNDEDEKNDPIIYQNKGYTYDIACKTYCKQNNKTQETLTEKDKEEIWNYVYDDWEYLLMWVIENNCFVYSSKYYGENNKNNFMEVVNKIKSREYKPTEFFLMTNGFLYKEEISSKIVGFIEEYINNSNYNNGKYYAKEGNLIGAYFVELQHFANERLHTDIYGFDFKWEEYDEFKNNINNAYRKFLKTSMKEQ